ncbi:MAG TPA: hypothetical protein VIC71_05700 [Gammaproteobacteria bacterium]|jgi:hypothetical protein
MNRKSLLAAQGLLVFTAFAGAGVAAEKEGEVEGEGFDRTPVDCISVNRIKQTKVIDDQTVLFVMNGGVYLSNILTRTCPGLGREKRFMHETNGRLCDIDTITVLEQWGTSFRSGFTCQLGQFYPITEIEADELVLGPEAAGEAPEVEVKEVELPPDATPPDAEPGASEAE